MRVAYVDPAPVPGLSPPQIQILYVVDGLAQAGAEVVLITPRASLNPSGILGRPLSNGVSLKYLPDIRRKWWFPFSSDRPFRILGGAAVKGLTCDAVVVRNLKLADNLLAGLPGVPLYFESHELFAQSLREAHPGVAANKIRGLEERERRVYSGARGLFALTRALATDIRASYRVETPIAVLPDGVDLEQADRAEVQGQQHDKLVFLYLGSLHPWKGVGTLVRAMPKVQSGHLRVIGGTAERIRELKTLSQSLGVQDRVEFLGPVDPSCRFDVIKQADVCLLPLTRTSIGSRFTSPLKLFEYMAASKPIVVGDLPSTREVLTPEVDALMVEAESSEGFASAMNRLADDPVLRYRLGLAARQLAEAYSWRRRGEQMINFITRTS